MNVAASEIHDYLCSLYGREAGNTTYNELSNLLERYRPRLPRPGPRRLTEADVVLITYGDMVREAGERPLGSLAHFLSAHLRERITAVHLLPFYPYSSDDGFSVIDYKQVDPKLGAWDDVHEVGRHFRLMFDAVINHISVESEWFRRFLAGDATYQDYFVVVPPQTDLSQVFRPRALPLLTPFPAPGGEKLVWTTFSEDQVDLNFANPKVLLRIVDVLLFYVAQGAELIRLDAIAFLWKEPGTSSVHLPQTHRLIQLFRSLLDEVAPQVILITETNVPHKDNVSYFGDGYSEAQMVYNFSLPPLTLHAFHTGSAAILSQCAAGLTLPSDQTSFFNFLASHDGIGVTPARDLLPPEAIQALVDRVAALGGRISYRHNADGSQTPYELNVNYLDALGDPAAGTEPPERVARRFLAAQAIMLSLRGVPGIYFHSLFGSRSWPEGVAQTGRNRTINRQKVERETLEAELADPGSLRHHVFYPYLELLQKRAGRAAFHPNGDQEVMFYHDAVFSLLRTSPDGDDHVLCLHNVSGQRQEVIVNRRQLPLPPDGPYLDLVSGHAYPAPPSGRWTLTLEPYQVIWLCQE
jgi:glucosylglycerate phosphorylase